MKISRIWIGLLFAFLAIQSQSAFSQLRNAGPIDAVRDTGLRILESGSDAIDAVRNAIPIREWFGKQTEIDVRAHDEVWLINARQSHLQSSCINSISVSRYEQGQLVSASLEELTSAHLTDCSKETVVYVHGNQTDSRWSVSRGMRLYSEQFYRAGPSTPVRFVIFQWKSERELKSLWLDYLVKSERAIQIGTTLANVLGEFQNRDVTVLGYSLGAQVVLSAYRHPSTQTMADGNGYRVALIAPALNCGFNYSATQFPVAGNQVEQTLVFTNSNDKVIKASQVACRRKYCRNGVIGNSKLRRHSNHGRSNFVRNPGAGQNPKVDFVQTLMSGAIPLGKLLHFEIGHEIRSRHAILNYVTSPTLKRSINQMIDAFKNCPGHCLGTENQISVEPISVINSVALGSSVQVNSQEPAPTPREPRLRVEQVSIPVSTKAVESEKSYADDVFDAIVNEAEARRAD